MSKWANRSFFWANRSFANFFAINERFAQKTDERSPNPGFQLLPDQESDPGPQPWCHLWCYFFKRFIHNLSIFVVVLLLVFLYLLCRLPWRENCLCQLLLLASILDLLHKNRNMIKYILIWNKYLLRTKRKVSSFTVTLLCVWVTLINAQYFLDFTRI